MQQFAPSGDKTEGSAVPEGQEEQKHGYEEKLKKNYEDFMAIIEKEAKKEVPMPEKNGHSALASVLKTPIEKEMNRVKHVKCVEAI